VIYLHVPFCRSFCTYCSFYSEICTRQGQEAAASKYADAVLREIQERKEELKSNIVSPGSVDTLYIGGGTPSVLPLDVLGSLVCAIKHETGTRFSDEFTIEVNPEDIIEKGDEYVAGLLALGASRISMGVQSFDDGILRWMNRRHGAEQARTAYKTIRKTALAAGKEISVSIDLIFGLTQLEDNVWQDTISQAMALGKEVGLPSPEHISAYQLSIEEGSSLEKLVARGKYQEASEELCAHQYEILCSRLSEAGYHHYEVSNFALPGHEAVHNSAYWRRIPYVGLGPGAHSFRFQEKDGTVKEIRSWNSEGIFKIASEEETLSPEDIRVERIMLGLRTDVGLPAKALRSLADSATIDSLMEDGALEIVGENVRIPESRFFTSDEIIRELI